MEINIALDNFKRAYNDLIGALEGDSKKESVLPKEDEKNYVVLSDIGPYFYFAKNKEHAKTQFRKENGYNHIKIINVKEIL